MSTQRIEDQGDMEAHNYRSNGLFEDGVLKCMAISVLFHVVVFLAALGASRLMPSRKVDSPPCTVSLVTMRDLGGGGAGKEGAMSKGGWEPPPAGGSEAIPSPPEPEAAAVPEPEKADAVERTKVVNKETISLIPVPKRVEKPVEKPKLIPKRKSVPKPPRKPRTVAKAETLPPRVPSAPGEGHGSSGSTLSGHGEGFGRPDGEGAGKGHSGEGAGASFAGGAGSGSGGVGEVGGVGGGHGPFHAVFGSGDGPQFATKVLPKYPRVARELGKEGTVLLLVTIDELGRLVHAEIIKRAGAGFDEEALLAVKSSTFEPARRNGKPVLCKANLPILFQLK